MGWSNLQEEDKSNFNLNKNALHSRKRMAIAITMSDESKPTDNNNSPADGFEMLGVRKAATPQQHSEKEHLHKKLGRLIKAISACPLKAHKVWISYITILIKSITYSLLCALFAANEFESFHKLLFPILLPLLGYQRNIQREIVVGSKFTGGIGCCHFSTVQFSKKVIGIMKHV
eukprot:1055822-Ditylum_brightwellii.AAC.2